MAIQYNHDHEKEITIFAETNFRNAARKFGIKTDDRRRHIYVVGKTGMGKTTLLENFFVSDILAGHGCCYVDPHGDTAEKLVDFIPPSRINDVVYFNPSDIDFPMGFNILETDNDEQKPLIASGLMGVFKKIWPDVWSPRMEYILMNCVLALLDYPGATLMGINRLLVDKEYRARVVAKLRDPIVKTFWVAEFTSWSEKYATEAIAPVQNKVGQFLSSSVIRNIVAQVKSTINLRRIMDDGKILIVNLSKGRIGEDNMRLLGGMLITKLQMAAQERQNIPDQTDRRDFYLYVDEFQNFANESFASILSEARKYRLNLIVAHQYIEQLDEKVRAAIFGNVGTIISMRVGGADAAFMETEFAPTFTPEDLVNLGFAQIYLKLSVDGIATPPFSATTLPPIAKRMESVEKVIAVSRERYAEPRALIEEKVLKWSGMEATSAGLSAVLLGVPTPAPVVEVVPNTTQLQYPSIKTAEEMEAASSSLNDVGPSGEGEYLTILPERLAAIVASKPASQEGKKKKPQFTYTCSRCGKVFQIGAQLDTSRPIYCTECRPIILEEQKKRQEERAAKPRLPLPPLRAPESASKSGGANRPRIVRSEPTKDEDERLPPPVPSRVKEKDKKPEVRNSLLDEIMRAKGAPVETRKEEVEKRIPDLKFSDAPAVEDSPVKPPSSEGRRGQGRGGRDRSDRPRERSSHDRQDGASSAPRRTSPPPVPPRIPSREKPRPPVTSDDDTDEGTSVAPGQRIKF